MAEKGPPRSSALASLWKKIRKRKAERDTDDTRQKAKIALTSRDTVPSYFKIKKHGSVAASAAHRAHQFSKKKRGERN